MKYGYFDEGGAINALYEKKVLVDEGILAADPEEAHTLIGRSIDYILETENLLEDDKYEKVGEVSNTNVMPDKCQKWGFFCRDIF